MEKVLLIDKAADWTSFDVVAKIRSGYSQKEGKKIKVGHAGTLDPFATGLLIVLLGAETKNQDLYMKQEKEYEATLKLGYVSSTGDPEGEITGKSDFVPDLSEIKKVLLNFTGEISQVPPAHSAIKVDGKRAYQLARAGQKVELKPRQVTISSIDIVSYQYPELKILVACSSGTYIRSLAFDIGEALGCGAYLTALRRTKIGSFSIENAHPIDFYLSL